MRKKNFIFSIAIFLMLLLFTSCEDDFRKVDVEYEYQLMQGTHEDITGTIEYVNAKGNLVSGGTISKIPFEASFDADKGFDNVKMVITFNPLPETASIPIRLNQRASLELEDIERQFTPTQIFSTVKEYNNFCATPQIFVIE